MISEIIPIDNWSIESGVNDDAVLKIEYQFGKESHHKIMELEFKTKPDVLQLITPRGLLIQVQHPEFFKDDNHGDQAWSIIRSRHITIQYKPRQNHREDSK